MDLIKRIKKGHEPIDIDMTFYFNCNESIKVLVFLLKYLPLINQYSVYLHWYFVIIIS